MKNNLKKGRKIFEIKNRGSPNSSVVIKLIFYFMINYLKKGVLYTIKMNLIKGLYRKLNNR